MQKLTVGEIMSPGIVTCRPDDTLSYVARLLSDAEISALVVVSPDSVVPIGVISQFDLVDYFGTDLDSVRASEAMTSPVAEVLTTDKVQTAIERMKRERVHRLVVLADDGYAASGVISITDVIHAMRRAQGFGT